MERIDVMARLARVQFESVPETKKGINIQQLHYQYLIIIMTIFT